VRDGVGIGVVVGGMADVVRGIESVTECVPIDPDAETDDDRVSTRECETDTSIDMVSDCVAVAEDVVENVWPVAVMMAETVSAKLAVAVGRGDKDEDGVG
jgi:hypothetical protein